MFREAAPWAAEGWGEMKRLLLVGALALGAGAAEAGNSPRLMVLNGTCKAAQAMDVRAGAGRCDGKIVNVNLPNGRLGFTFYLRGDGGGAVVISFFGNGSTQFHPDANRAVQPIDRVHFTMDGITEDIAGEGLCSFSNPYLGKPVKVECTAVTSRGRFGGVFVSDGKPPV